MLTRWAECTWVQFFHVQCSASDFLAALRREYSLWFMDQVLRLGAADPNQPGVLYLDAFRPLDVDDLYEWRRNATGRSSAMVVRQRRPGAGPQVPARAVPGPRRGGRDLAVPLQADEHLRVAAEIHIAGIIHGQRYGA